MKIFVIVLNFSGQK